MIDYDIERFRKTVIKTMAFEHLKIGDKVKRQMGLSIMTMMVIRIEGSLLVCAAVDNDVGELDPMFGVHLFHGDWTFDRNTGAEEDDDLHWGVKYGATGSFLIAGSEEIAVRH